MKASQFWHIANVATFQGYDVDNNGEISIPDSDHEEYLTEVYGYVSVCGQEFGAGSLLVDADPVAFRCSKGEREANLESELVAQLENENSDQIEFIDGDEWELDEEEDDE